VVRETAPTEAVDVSSSTETAPATSGIFGKNGILMSNHFPFGIRLG
jgi:hypothetical protein